MVRYTAPLRFHSCAWMRSAACTHVREWKIGRETSLVQTFQSQSGLSVSVCLALPLVNRLSLGPPGSPRGPGGRRGRIGVDLPGATPASCPLLAAPAEGMRMKSCLGPVAACGLRPHCKLQTPTPAPNTNNKDPHPASITQHATCNMHRAALISYVVALLLTALCLIYVTYILYRVRMRCRCLCLCLCLMRMPITNNQYSDSTSHEPRTSRSPPANSDCLV
jgi:hypothetical protein